MRAQDRMHGLERRFRVADLLSLSATQPNLIRDSFQRARVATAERRRATVLHSPSKSARLDYADPSPEPSGCLSLSRTQVLQEHSCRSTHQ